MCLDVGLDPWPPGSSKSPIFPNFEGNLTKYIRNLKSADHGRTLFEPSTSLGRKKLPWGLARSPIDGHLELRFPSHGTPPTLVTLISRSEIGVKSK
jgi:hypothetical protein